VLSVQLQQTGRSEDNTQALVIGLVVGLCALGALLAALATLYVRQAKVSDADKLFQMTMSQLRARLGITTAQGYFLNTEPITREWWRFSKPREVIVIQKGHLEAAVKLELYQEFDVGHFDALCVCLQYSDPQARFEGSTSRCWERLCSWVLEVSESLIRPSLEGFQALSAGAGVSDGTKARPRHCPMRLDARFLYFTKYLCKTRIWSEKSNALFAQLRESAGVFMDDIAGLCGERFKQLQGEPGGQELTRFFVLEAETGQLVDIRRQDHAEVRAVVVHEEAAREADLQRLSRVDSTTALDEEVFIAQLAHRARLLDHDFQARVLAIVAAHGTPVPTDEPDSSAESRVDSAAAASGKAGEQPTSSGHRSRPGEMALDVDLSSAPSQGTTTTSSKTLTRLFSNPLGGIPNPVSRVTSSPLDQGSFVLQEGRQPVSVTAMLGTVSSAGRSRKFLPSSLSGASSSGEPGTVNPFSRAATAAPPKLRAASSDGDQQEASLASAKHVRGRRFNCTFRDGSVAVVEVCSAPVKNVSRMREKLSEYAAERAPWPHCAQILDPVRTTVVCEGPARMLEVAGWFIHATSSPHSAVIGPATLPICKVKNKFALQDSELVGGYRDLMFCGVLEGAGGLRIIGEVQIHDRVLHDLKTLMHKLYRIRRAKAASGV